MTVTLPSYSRKWRRLYRDFDKNLSRIYVRGWRTVLIKKTQCLSILLQYENLFFSKNIFAVDAVSGLALKHRTRFSRCQSLRILCPRDCWYCGNYVFDNTNTVLGSLCQPMTSNSSKYNHYKSSAISMRPSGRKSCNNVPVYSISAAWRLASETNFMVSVRPRKLYL
jgi:hypothetical protein